MKTKCVGAMRRTVLGALALCVCAAPTPTRGQIVIHACVKSESGALRVIPVDETCKRNEYPLTLRGSGCPDDSVAVGSTCVDKYEASVWEIASDNATLIAKVKGGSVTLDDLQAAGATQRGAGADDYTCSDTSNDCNAKEYAVSVAGVIPARFVTWFQAQQFCRLAGKRLVANAEWQAAAAGTPDDAPCVVDDSAPGLTGTAGCVSNAGAFDMVGNVSEWVGDWSLPANSCSSGLYEPRDDNCMMIDWIGGLVVPGPAALIRGGYFSPGGGVSVYVGRDAGVFAVNSLHQPSFTSLALGFRCAR